MGNSATGAQCLTMGKHIPLAFKAWEQSSVAGWPTSGPMDALFIPGFTLRFYSPFISSQWCLLIQAGSISAGITFSMISLAFCAIHRNPRQCTGGFQQTFSGLPHLHSLLCWVSCLDPGVTCLISLAKVSSAAPLVLSPGAPFLTFCYMDRLRIFQIILWTFLKNNLFFNISLSSYILQLAVRRN